MAEVASPATASGIVRDFVVRMRGGGLLAVLARGAVLAMVLQVAGVGLSTLLNVLLARELGPTGYGAFAFGFSWVTILALLGGLGIPVMLIRYVSQYSAAGDDSQLAALLRFSRNASLAASVVIGLVGIGLLALIRPDGLSIPAIVIAMAAVPLMVQLTLQTQVARSLGHIALAYAPFWPLRQTMVLAAVGVLLVATGSLDPELAFVALVAGLGVVTVGQWWRLRRFAPKAGLDAKPAPGNQAAWTNVSFTLLLVQVMRGLMEQGGIIIVGLLATAGETGTYAATVRVALLGTLVLTGINTVVAPNLSRLYYEGRTDALQRVALAVARASSLYAFVVLAGAGLLAGPVLGLFGEEFESGAWALRILLLGQLANASTGPVGALLSTTGHHSITATTTLVVTAAFVVAAFAFTRLWGIEGTAIAATAARSSLNFMLVFQAKRRLNVRSFVF